MIPFGVILWGFWPYERLLQFNSHLLDAARSVPHSLAGFRTFVSPSDWLPRDEDADGPYADVVGVKEVVADVEFIEGERDFELRPPRGEVGRAAQGNGEFGSEKWSQYHLLWRHEGLLRTWVGRTRRLSSDRLGTVFLVLAID